MKIPSTPPPTLTPAAVPPELRAPEDLKLKEQAVRQPAADSVAVGFSRSAQAASVMKELAPGTSIQNPKDSERTIQDLLSSLKSQTPAGIAKTLTPGTPDAIRDLLQ